MLFKWQIKKEIYMGESLEMEIRRIESPELIY